jgi:hypothetical protein
MIASVSLPVYQPTTKLLVVTVLLVESIWALAVEASAVRTAKTARNRTETLRARDFILKKRWPVIYDLLSCGRSEDHQFVTKCDYGCTTCATDAELSPMFESPA